MGYFTADAPLVEFVGTPEIFVSGVGDIEDIGGGCVRFTFYVMEKGQRIVTAKIVMPISAVPDGVAKTTAMLHGAVH